MDTKEAAKLANTIDVKVIIPTHYGEIVGEKTDGEEFAKQVLGKQVEVLIK